MLLMAVLVVKPLYMNSAQGEPAAKSLSIQQSDETTPLGKRAPEWENLQWVQGGPLTLEALRGKAVLVRWFTAAQCPYCSATAPALNEFHKDYGGRGLQVVGMYHHKSASPFGVEDVRQVIAQYGFAFPVAIDPSWENLERWWLKYPGRRWTSVSFLLDAKGTIRHIHPGGKYVKGDEDYQALVKAIEALLKAPDAEPGH